MKTNFPLENKGNKTGVKGKNPSSLRVMDLALNLGFFMVIPQVLGVFIGLLLDKRFNTKPLFTLVFLTIGLIVGIVSVYKRIKNDFLK